MSSEQTASSSSGSRVVAKIVIDLDEYERLKQLEGHLKIQEKKLNNQLHTSIVQQGQGEKNLKKELVKESGEIQEENPELKIKTENPVSESVKDDIVKTLKHVVVNEVIKKLASTFGLVLPDISQVGAGSDLDTVQPQQPLIENPSSNAPMLIPIENQKETKTTPATENFVLSKVPPSFIDKAKLLLSAFDENPQQLTWNPEGQVYIENSSVPQANFYDLFPALFSTGYKQLPGFPEFVNQIASMGLGQLIHPKLLRGFRRKRKIENPDTIYNEVVKNDKWYFLGPV